ncbi:Mut7-C RNAse domain-containing protein [Geodermatophilus sp. SYSU D00703]
MAGTAGTPSPVDVVVPAPLRFLLPGRDRHRGIRRVQFDPDATVGHLVQAAGVPLTEVGDLRVDGAPAGASDRTRPGSTVELSEAPRPQSLPPGGFLLDVGLGALARRLRLLGLDAAWSNDADDADLVARATAEQRALLTQDRGLLMRRALGRAGSGRAALVRGARPDDQLADVLDRFAPPLAPLTRCTACGARLQPVAKADVADRLPDGTRRTYDEFSRCPSCDRVYWRGAHARRIDALVRTATR